MYQRLLKDSTIYGLGALVIRSLAFFTLPIYTHIFSPETFGVIEMFATIGGILSLIMTMGLDSTQSYYFMEAKNKKTHDTKDIIGSILGLRIIIGVFIIGLTSALSPFIIDFTFETNVPILYLIMVSFAIFFTNLLSQSLEIFRLLYKPWHYIGLSFLQTISSIALILFFILIKDMGIFGYFLGMLLSSLLIMLFGLWLTMPYRSFLLFERKLWKDFLKFGAPLVPAGLSIWLMQAGDRWFVMNMLGASDLGIYAVGAKISMLLAVAVQVFRQAWWPIAMDIIQKPEGPTFIRNISFLYLGLGTIGALFLAYIAPFLTRLLASDAYFEGYRLIGLLGWASVLYGFYLISGLGIFKSKKTHLSFYANFFGAILNIILNYFLILRFGILGAAFATILSLYIANSVTILLSNIYMPIKWSWVNIVFMGVSSFIIIFSAEYR